MLLSSNALPDPSRDEAHGRLPSQQRSQKRPSRLFDSPVSPRLATSRQPLAQSTSWNTRLGSTQLQPLLHTHFRSSDRSQVNTPSFQPLQLTPSTRRSSHSFTRLFKHSSATSLQLPTSPRPTQQHAPQDRLEHLDKETMAGHDLELRMHKLHKRQATTTTRVRGEFYCRRSIQRDATDLLTVAQRPRHQQ